MATLIKAEAAVLIAGTIAAASGVLRWPLAAWYAALAVLAGALIAAGWRGRARVARAALLTAALAVAYFSTGQAAHGTPGAAAAELHRPGLPLIAAAAGAVLSVSSLPRKRGWGSPERTYGWHAGRRSR